MSQAGSFIKGGGTAVVETLTGNTGGAVGPDGANNINVVGDTTTVNVAGNPGTNTLTISATGSVPIQFDEDVGSAVPALGILNVLGGTAINTSGAGNTVTINADATIATQYTEDVGSAVPSGNNLNIFGGSNINTSGATDIVTVNLDESIAQPATNNIYAGIAGSQGWYALNSNRFMHAYGTNNTFLGSLSGNNTLTGNGNVGLGTDSLTSLTTGNNNTVVGESAGSSLADGLANTYIGASAGFLDNSGQNNVGIGYSALLNNTGSSNVGVGYFSLASLSGGSYNIAIGENAGSNYGTTESSNLLIGNDGIASEDNTTRIGTQGSGNGQQNTCYVAGIVGNTVSNAEFVVIDSTTGQLGVQSESPVAIEFDADTGVAIPSGGVLNVNGTGGITTSGSGNTLTIDGNTTNVPYEEGTWTPTLSFGGGSVGITYSINSGTYTRIGNRVTLNCQITLSNKGSSTGSAVISGLPFAAAANNADTSTEFYYANLTGSNLNQILVVPTTTSTLPLYGSDGVDSVFAVDNSYFTNTTNIIFSLTYRISDSTPSITTTAYEEGSWTPVLKFGGASTGIIYSTQSGNYTRIGNRIIATAKIILSSKGTSTGTATITGLPYNPATSTMDTATVLYYDAISYQYGICLASDTSGTIKLWAENAGPAGTIFALEDSNFYDTTSIAFNLIYRIADGSPTIPGFGWTEVTGTSASMVAGNGYIANNGSLVTLTLPSSASQGSTIEVAGKGAGLYKIAQNAGQTIHYGSTSTTTGAGGSLTAIEQYDSLRLLCVTTDTDFVVLSSVGNFTVV